MILNQQILKLKTNGRGLIDISDKIITEVNQSTIETGLCHIFIHHTSASVILCENADPSVKHDLEAFLERFIPDSDSLYQHTFEGIDDMPAHVRTVLTGSFLVIPITQKKLALGTWQGIYVWEHRLKSHERKLTITLQGI